MNQWWTIYQKETLEKWRSFKWIWIPLVFFLLAITDPLSTYYMPVIIESFGGLPEGATIDIPTPPVPDVLMMSFGQFDLIGMIIMVIVTASLIAGERKSGVTELVLVKPVRYSSYISAKWASMVSLILSSTFIGVMASWYYINLLFGELSFGSAMAAFAFHAVWYVFILTLTLFFSTMFKLPGLVAFISILVLALLNLFNSVFRRQVEWLPPQMSFHIRSMLGSETVTGEMWATTGFTLVLITALLAASVFVFRKKEMAA
ncbi:ABC transporter permease [Pontibacillus salicampi]|uniref:ABC transporter permease n=1 Tax=Pontibacillus salicampi TaxID=1449801 RepID=A0ABV6LI41_9BACI